GLFIFFGVFCLIVLCGLVEIGVWFVKWGVGSERILVRLSDMFGEYIACAMIRQIGLRFMESVHFRTVRTTLRSVVVSVIL
ncbi:hypothetical protein, partial [Leptospira interrogans]|uniref:hypothetical protein n=1 Tax=Leptospira interrogans TaxID=173 RepID=UPI001D154F52